MHMLVKLGDVTSTLALLLDLFSSLVITYEILGFIYWEGNAFVDALFSHVVKLQESAWWFQIP